MPPEPLHTGPIYLAAEGRVCRIETVAGELPARLRALTSARRGLIILDRAFEDEAGVWPDHLPGFQVFFTEARGEEAKSLAEAQRLLAEMARLKLARDDWLIVRGGGSLTDLGAFCAGLYRRGLNLILVPTTVLAAVDAAVGGKTAINFAVDKNQVGHFYLPGHGLVDLEAFGGLPKARIAEGLVEAYKTGLLFDETLARLVADEALLGLNPAPERLAEMVARSYAAKAALVARDFREEKGIRDVLNLGHTYGHVLESFHYPRLSHGQAVAAGLAVMAELSRELGLLKGPRAESIIETSRRLGGPWPDLPGDDIAEGLLMTDKKIRGGRLRFVALKEAEGPRLIETTAPELIAAARRIL